MTYLPVGGEAVPSKSVCQGAAGIGVPSTPPLLLEIFSEMNRTAPSQKAKFAPPGWELAKLFWLPWFSFPRTHEVTAFPFWARPSPAQHAARSGGVAALAASTFFSPMAKVLLVPSVMSEYFTRLCAYRTP